MTMYISQEDFSTLQALEESLWVAETRFDNDHMERTLSPDFFEVGCSGRIYKREDTLAATARPFSTKLPLIDFQVLPIAENVVQVTYISEVTYDDEMQICNRSSIWVRTSTGWQLRFHQGTPVPK